MMAARALGRTGLTVPALGLGTSHIASLTAPHGPARMARLLDEAYARGIRFFDTANIYGQGDAERLLARVAGRDGTVICTKAGLSVGRLLPAVRAVKPVLRPLIAASKGLRSGTSRARKAQERHDLSEDGLSRALTGSLERLRRDAVDLFLLHSPPRAALADDRLFEFLHRIKAEGRARAVGISLQHLDDLAPLLARGGLDAVQVPLSAADLGRARPMLQAAQAAGIGLIAREVLTGASDPAAALSAILADPLIPVSLIGTTNPAHLAQNIAVAERATGVA